MLGIGQATVRSLLERGKLGSKKIRDAHRIFLSDLEDYLGEERARSLVRDLGGDEPGVNDGQSTSRYEPVAQKWSELDDNESIVLSDLEKIDIRNIRDLLYRRFGKEEVVVRSAKQEDGRYKAVIRAREGGEYLRD